MYNVKSLDANEFIDNEEVLASWRKPPEGKRQKKRLRGFWLKPESVKVLPIGK